MATCANPAGMRLTDPEFNRLAVLKRLRESEPVSRTTLAGLTGLNGATITAITRDLLARGLVREERAATPGRGRPRVDLRLNADAAHVMGATLSTTGRIQVEIADMRGEAVLHHSVQCGLTTSLADLADQFVAAMREATSAHSRKGAVALAGIGLPAIVDARAGQVINLHTFQPGPYAFADHVSRALGFPVRVDNNINLLARAEHWYGEGVGAGDFTVVLFDHGLGAATYRAGQLHVGAQGIESEFAHVKIMPDGGRACYCGGRGCLETYSSMTGVAGQYLELAGLPSPELRLLGDSYQPVLERLAEGDAHARVAVSRAGAYLGTALANHINMDAPERIVILAAPGVMVPTLSEALMAALERDTFPPMRGRTRVVFRELADFAYARGAAAMVLEQVFQT